MTRAEKEALDALVELAQRLDLVGEEGAFLGASERRNIPKNISIRKEELNTFTALNALLSSALSFLADQENSPIRRNVADGFSTMMEDMAKRAQELLSQSGRVAPFVLTGEDAKIYFAILNWAHERWYVVRKQIIENAEDVKTAERHTAEMLWAIRSILNVGHLPVESSRFLKG